MEEHEYQEEKGFSPFHFGTKGPLLIAMVPSKPLKSTTNRQMFLFLSGETALQADVVSGFSCSFMSW